ncbi:hypothetical protein [Beijerinckia indica]|uniref:Uncharacterized protein n=1 Tax=Beijerinckia indica subsp. indica (strain ATCC 9039 / DSM 1715 / NCIMB 8712) TaxID=395963 RepID=B2IL56_BEII9|nr:hypothetical protein [Beijerinckia indica]ACB97256.1 hypothetical protein Bind_3704 [Beijerinckia indica subsp. indica ATCC 9039]
MLFRIKALLLLQALFFSQTALAGSLCQTGLKGITLTAGTYDPPGILAPDSQLLKPIGQWPENLIEQGWHNLRKAPRPLVFTCRYKDGREETILLSEKVDACFLRAGLSFNCE